MTKRTTLIALVSIYCTVLAIAAFVLTVAPIHPVESRSGFLIIFFTACSAVFVGWVVQQASNAEAAISKTYQVIVDAPSTAITSAFPVYRIPPDEDKTARIRYACAPLVDCCTPLLYKQLDPTGWQNLSRTHAIEVTMRTTSFHDLFEAVRRAGSSGNGESPQADVVIASATAVIRAQHKDHLLTQLADDPPMAILPVLQEFNAYYLFAKREPLLEYFNDCTLPGAVYLNSATEGLSLHEKLGSSDRFCTATRGLLRTADVLVEQGADLDMALIYYWENALKGRRTAAGVPINFSDRAGTIATTFEQFCTSDKLAIYVGGLAQSAYLLNRCSLGEEFVLIAGPEDIAFRNVNSFVCTREFGISHRNDLVRLYNWWFDLTNRFRREYLFGPPAAREALQKLISAGVTDDSGALKSLVPACFESRDLDVLLGFISTKSDAEAGSFLLPNFSEANAVKLQLVERLKQVRAVMDVLTSAPSTEPPNLAGQKASA